MISVLSRASAVGGGLAFALFWICGLLDISIGEWSLSLVLHALTIVLLTWAGVAILRTRTAGPDPIGSLGLALIVIGLVASLELVMVGMLLFGWRAASGRISTVARAGAFLLVGGAAAFIIVRAINGPFWGDGTPDPPAAATAGFAVSLVALGLGWIVLGLALSVRESRSQP